MYEKRNEYIENQQRSQLDDVESSSVVILTYLESIYIYIYDLFLFTFEERNKSQRHTHTGVDFNICVISPPPQ